MDMLTVYVELETGERAYIEDISSAIYSDNKFKIYNWEYRQFVIIPVKNVKKIDIRSAIVAKNPLLKSYAVEEFTIQKMIEEHNEDWS